RRSSRRHCRRSCRQSATTDPARNTSRAAPRLRTPRGYARPAAHARCARADRCAGCGIACPAPAPRRPRRASHRRKGRCRLRVRPPARGVRSRCAAPVALVLRPAASPLPEAIVGTRIGRRIRTPWSVPVCAAGFPAAARRPVRSAAQSRSRRGPERRSSTRYRTPLRGAASGPARLVLACARCSLRSGGTMFTQSIDPLNNLTLTCLVALVPVVFLLVALAVFRLPAWLATLLGSLLTFALGVWVWNMPFDEGSRAYLYGSATGVWNVDWITFWGLVLFNTLNISGIFENFRRWLIAQGSLDVRVQT